MSGLGVLHLSQLKLTELNLSHCPGVSTPVPIFNIHTYSTVFVICCMLRYFYQSQVNETLLLNLAKCSTLTHLKLRGCFDSSDEGINIIRNIYTFLQS